MVSISNTIGAVVLEFSQSGDSATVLINVYLPYECGDNEDTYPANISQVGHMWPHVATNVFNMATSGNIIQVVRHLNAM